jgi:hypothetical protein
MTPDELVQAFGTAIDARQASLLVGAGMSRGAGFPLWEELVDGAAVQVGVPKVDDFPLWAQYVEDASDGAAVLIDEVVRRIASVEPMPMENHRLMVKLPISDFWTTNYDPMIETVDSALDVVDHDEALVLRRVCDSRQTVRGLARPPPFRGCARSDATRLSPWVRALLRHIKKARASTRRKTAPGLQRHLPVSSSTGGRLSFVCVPAVTPESGLEESDVEHLDRIWERSSNWAPSDVESGG